MVGIPAEKAEETRAVLAVLIEKAVPMLRPYSEKIPVPVPVKSLDEISRIEVEVKVDLAREDRTIIPVTARPLHIVSIAEKITTQMTQSAEN